MCTWSDDHIHALVTALVRFIGTYHRPGVGLHSFQLTPYVVATRLLGSLVCRLKSPLLTPGYVLRGVIYPLVEFLLTYVAKHKGPDLSRSPASHSAYYAVFQCVAYVFAWYGIPLLQPRDAGLELPAATSGQTGAPGSPEESQPCPPVVRHSSPPL